MTHHTSNYYLFNISIPYSLEYKVVAVLFNPTSQRATFTNSTFIGNFEDWVISVSSTTINISSNVYTVNANEGTINSSVIFNGMIVWKKIS